MVEPRLVPSACALSLIALLRFFVKDFSIEHLGLSGRSGQLDWNSVPTGLETAILDKDERCFIGRCGDRPATHDYFGSRFTETLNAEDVGRSQDPSVRFAVDQGDRRFEQILDFVGEKLPKAMDIRFVIPVGL